ncbi:prolyl oligopeptidase family serine peptidase [Aliikangiella sp. IMCC44632]
MKINQAYGSWPSTLTAEVLADKGRRFGHLALDDSRCYWIEIRAQENGRGALVSADSSGQRTEVLPSDISVRSKVHEYGGGDYCVSKGNVYFSNAKDNQVYRFAAGELTCLTKQQANQEMRYADFKLSPNEKFLVAVRETHFEQNVINELVLIEIATMDCRVLHKGFDFYLSPRFSKGGHRLSWVCWNQPDMPWDASELWLADFHADGSISAEHKVCGGETSAVFQPEWSDDGVLHYLSDASGWDNIYSQRDGVLNALTPIDRDFGVPQWIFGLGTYVINPDNTLYALSFENGQQKLVHIDPETGHIEPIPLPFKHFEGALLGDANALYFCAASPADEIAIYRYDIESKQCLLLSDKSQFILEQEDISMAEPISFNSPSSADPQRTSYAFYYAPKNSRFQCDDETAPPLIVMSHGGPTSFSDNSLNPAIQFWTNRGFAVVDVNYAGSTGYGKRYRELLLGNWGIVDVEDCIAAANYLVEKGLANAEQLLIRGGSAGGYTTLCALTFHDVFAAGMSRYGVADLECLAADSHKFEARYLDKLVGNYPEDKAVYQARSPIHSSDKLSCPILLLQGEDDKVVPPNQAEMMVAALEKKKIPYSYLLFAGEGHGFRQAETIVKAFNAELYFYRTILGIESEEKLEPIKIHHF